jgi:hypothetical protein
MSANVSRSGSDWVRKEDREHNNKGHLVFVGNGRFGLASTCTLGCRSGGSSLLLGFFCGSFSFFFLLAPLAFLSQGIR